MSKIDGISFGILLLVLRFDFRVNLNGATELWCFAKMGLVALTFPILLTVLSSVDRSLLNVACSWLRFTSLEDGTLTGFIGCEEPQLLTGVLGLFSERDIDSSEF